GIRDGHVTEFRRVLFRSQGSKAETAFRTALKIRLQLADDHPKVLEYQRDLAGTHYSLGELYSHTSGQPDQAQEALQKALEIQERSEERRVGKEGRGRWRG